MYDLTGRRPPTPAPLPDIDLAAVTAGADPFDLTTFCARLAAVRMRPIALLPIYSRPPHGGCLPWFAATDTDYVLVEENTTRLHRELLALHTLGHLLLAHPGQPVPAEVLQARRMPELDWRRLTSLIGPVVYIAGPHTEAHADTFAIAVLEQVGRLTDSARRTRATGADARSRTGGQT